MATKLKSVLRNPKSKLAFKALIFAGLLSLVAIGNFSWLTAFFLIIGSLTLYSRPLFRTVDLIWPLLALMVLALLSLWVLSGSAYWFFAVAYFAVLFYLILGIKDLAFISRVGWNQVLVLGLAYPAILLFFYYNQEFFWWKSVALFLAMLILFRYLIGRRIVAWLLAFMALELVWAIGLLPIGFLSRANLAITFYFVLADVAFHQYVVGHLSKRRILIDITVSAILILAVFAFSRWS
jgi:hypothetical protein